MTIYLEGDGSLSRGGGYLFRGRTVIYLEGGYLSRGWAAIYLEGGGYISRGREVVYLERLEFKFSSVPG